MTSTRWGNVLSISDPRSANWVTTYSYNANNQVIRQVQPDLGDGLGAPVTEIAYDALGRQVAVKDANGHVDGKVCDEGGNLVQEVQADGKAIRHAYDAFGNKVLSVDRAGRGCPDFCV